MRGLRLVVVLLVLLCLLLGMGWMLLRPGAEVPRPRVATAGPAADTAKPPLHTLERERKPATAAQDNKAGAAPEQAEQKWLFKGRIQWAPELLIDPRSFTAPEDWGVQIHFARHTDDGYDVGYCYLSVRPDGHFAESVQPPDLPFEAADGKVPDGLWQVAWDGGEAATLNEVDLDETKPESLSGIVKPAVHGRVIDFGTVVLGNRAFFGGAPMVTGRLVHSSGRPLAHCAGICFVLLDDDCVVAGEEIFTDGDGRFVKRLDDRLDEPIGKLKHMLYCNEQAEDVEDDPNGLQKLSVTLPTPKVRGDVLDYGEIKVGGALLEVTADIEGAKTLTRNGAPAVNYEGDYDGPYALLDIQNRDCDTETPVYPEHHVSCVWLPEGRYTWRGEVKQTGKFYPTARGAVNCLDGKVTQLALSFSALRTIPLELHCDGRPPDGVSVTWRATSDGKEVAFGDVEIRQPWRVPVFERAVTRVVVRADNFEPATGKVQPGDEKLVLILHARLEHVAILRVHLPDMPVLKHPGRLKLSLIARLEGTQTRPRARLRDGDTFVLMLPKAGLWRVSLEGGANYGHTGTLSGPVRVQVDEGEEKDVELPGITGVLWDHRADEFLDNVTCGGHSCSHELDMSVGHDRWSLHGETGGSFNPPGVPDGIIDGDRVVPVQVTPPDQDGGSAVMTADLTPRIEVRVISNGEPIDAFYARATFANYAMSRHSTGGVAGLWLPPGEATVRVYVANRMLTRTVRVERDKRLRVDFETDWVRLKTTVPQPDGDSHNDSRTPLWILQHEDGTYTEGVWHSDVFRLEPGRYRFVPVYGNTEPVNVDLSDGRNREIVLPELPAPGQCAVKLAFDTAPFGAGDIDIKYFRMLGGGCLQPTEIAIEDGDAASLPDGAQLPPQPQGADILLIAQAQSGDGRCWLTSPVRITPGPEARVAKTSLVRAVELGFDWQNLTIVTPSLVPGLYLPFNCDDYAFPGRQELFVLKDGKQVAHEWVDVPEASDEPFEIPAALRAALEAKGVLQPE